MAEQACHVFGSTTQVGLTQALASMATSSRSVEYVIYPVIIVAAIVFIPYVPTSTLIYPDPVDQNDERVRTELDSDDLRSVMRVVRRGSVNSLYEIEKYKTRETLLAINKDQSTDARSGGVEVQTGEICGPLCGAGKIYRLVKEDGRWRIVETSEWVS